MEAFTRITTGTRERIREVIRRKEVIVEKQTIRLVYPDGSAEVIKIDKDLYDRFAAQAKELGVSENDLFFTAMKAFLEKEGY
ncbi:hypothetical protein LCGC14_1316820 [marine sediment metagenome]|uniref:Uncharacterized protein n=1 Tax=marine sediment metagenome TaxID=412755 RepID=A0A0F9N1H6_9ZZZZ